MAPLADDSPLRCAVCASETDLEGVVAAGRPLHLCRTHADAFAQAAPSSADELAGFFEALDSDTQRGADRRHRERRFFPRPEGRRHNHGRRADDPRD
jgi:hypothetical protein